MSMENHPKRNLDDGNGGDKTPAKRVKIDTSDAQIQSFEMGVVTKKSPCKFKISGGKILAGLERGNFVDLSKLQHDVVVESPSGVQVTWGVKMEVYSYTSGLPIPPPLNLATKWLLLSVNLKEISHNKRAVCCNIKYQFQGQGGNLMSMTTSESFQNYKIGYGNSIYITKLDDIGNILAADGSLSVNLIFEIVEQIAAYKVKPLEKALAELKTKVAKKWTDTMKNLDNEQEANAMIKLVSCDGVETMIHQALLTAHSQVFEAMMRAPMVEAKTKTVNLRDFSDKTLKVLKRYFYTGELTVEELADIEVVHEITNVAAMYMLDDLLTFLDSHLGQICSTEAAYHLLGLAHNLNLKRAEKDILGLIKTHILDGN